MNFVARLTIRLFPVGFIVTIASVAVHAGTMVERRIEGGLVLTVPENVTMAEESPVEDFVLYKFFDSNGKVLLFAYLGNFPKGINAPSGAKITKSDVSGFHAVITRWSGQDDEKHGDIRLRLQLEGWPSWLQFSYGPLSKADASVAEQISTSVHPDGATRN